MAQPESSQEVSIPNRVFKECDFPDHVQIDPSFGVQSTVCLSLLQQWPVGTGYPLPPSVRKVLLESQTVAHRINQRRTFLLWFARKARWAVLQRHAAINTWGQLLCGIHRLHRVELDPIDGDRTTILRVQRQSLSRFALLVSGGLRFTGDFLRDNSELCI